MKDLNKLKKQELINLYSDIEKELGIHKELSETLELRNCLLEENVEQKRKTNIILAVLVSVEFFIIVICLLLLI
jgi:hypothetical protein